MKILPNNLQIFELDLSSNNLEKNNDNTRYLKEGI